MSLIFGMGNEEMLRARCGEHKKQAEARCRNQWVDERDVEKLERCVHEKKEGRNQFYHRKIFIFRRERGYSRLLRAERLSEIFGTGVAFLLCFFPHSPTCLNSAFFFAVDSFLETYLKNKMLPQ